MIEIIPSISIAGGKIAKLVHTETVNARLFDKSPIDLALFFKDHGMQRLHVVDLDGALAGEVINYELLRLISSYSELKINFSGGIRTDGSVQLALEHGASSVTVASIAATQPDVFTSWLFSFGREKLILGADVADGKIATKGWRNSVNTTPIDHIAYFVERGIKYVKLTDTKHSGELNGPNFELVKEVRNAFPTIQLMVSGGIRNVSDIEELAKIGANSLIIGTAFYEDKLSIEDLASFSLANK